MFFQTGAQQVNDVLHEVYIVCKIERNHALKGGNLKIFWGEAGGTEKNL